MNSELEQIVAEHTGLVKSVALRLSYIYGEEPEDMIQIGYIGLIKAARRFDPQRGLKFSTYAVPMIAGEIKSQMRDRGAIKVSRSIKSDAAVIRRTENDFTALNGRSPRISELSEITGMPAERVSQAIQAEDAMKNMEDCMKIDTAVCEEERNVNKIDISIVLEHLDPKSRQVMVLRYYRDMTQSDVAQVLGISQVQVCRIEKKALTAMAEKLDFD